MLPDGWTERAVLLTEPVAPAEESFLSLTPFARRGLVTVGWTRPPPGCRQTMLGQAALWRVPECLGLRWNWHRASSVAVQAWFPDQPLPPIPAPHRPEA
jgi:hypothetical protein